MPCKRKALNEMKHTIDMKRLLLTGIVIGLSLTQSFAQAEYIRSTESIDVGHEAHIFELDLTTVASMVADAPANLSEARGTAPSIHLPDPNGELLTLTVFDSPIMAKELADRFPQIQTFKVVGRGVNGRLSITEKGLHGILFSTSGTMYIDPVEGVENAYQAYNRADFVEAHAGEDHHECLVDEVSEALDVVERGQRRSGDQLRTYRLALACTGEYAQFHGGTVSSVLSAMVVTMNRVNGVYERDFSVTMEIIGNNDDLIFLNAITDPYTNNSGFAMLGQNQSTVDNIIGSANYDIGHVFSTGGGGIASLNSVCSFSNKARGVTGGGSPVGDPFDIDYVAHEMGHQFGGNHTQNNECNRNPTTAWEPGSAATIMGYAGICPPNLQSNSDDYFHSGNYDEIIAHVNNTVSSGCPVVTNTGNTAPTVTVDENDYVIPRETPFVLRGSAEDDEDDDMTYCWEQMDLGPSGSPTNPSGNAPIFRSWDPVDNGERTFPRLISVLTNSLVIGETYPTYSRGLSFRMSVRDNNPNGGGFAYDEVDLGVDGNKGPFVVTSPPQGGQAQAGVYYNVEWDVAGTDESPINCQEVHILAYSGNGLNFEDTIAANVPNTGSAMVVMPSSIGGGYRVRVEAADNVFFNYNPGAFSIVNPIAPVGADIVLAVTPDFATGSMVLNWNDPFDNENEWVIERSVNGNSSFVSIDTIGVNDTTYSDPNVSMFGTEYYYRVYARNPAGNSAYSNEDSWLGVGIDQQWVRPLKVFPNPAFDRLMVEIDPDRRIESIKIFNRQGSIVQEMNGLGQNGQIDVSPLSAGSYFIRLQFENDTVSTGLFNIVR